LKDAVDDPDAVEAGHDGHMHYQRIAAELDDRLAWTMSDPEEATNDLAEEA